MLFPHKAGRPDMWALPHLRRKIKRPHDRKAQSIMLLIVNFAESGQIKAKV
jgi:hypothetical protein